MTYSNDTREGYKNKTGTGLNFELLASTDYQTIPVCIDAAARDWGNPDGSTHLRAGLALGYDTSSGRYKQYKNPPHEAATVVVLAEEIRDINEVSLINSVAFFKGTFKSGAVIEAETAVTWSSVQRLSVRDNVTV